MANKRVYRDENGRLIFNLQFFASEPNLTSTANGAFNAAFAQSVDFANTFGAGISGLQKILQIARMVPVASGSTLKTYKSSVTLDNTVIAPGDIIPLSLVKQEPGDPITLSWDKKRKAVPAEDIQTYGLERAVANSDDLFIRELQKKVRTGFFTMLATGTGTATGEGLQAAAAKAWAGVYTAFEDDGAAVIGFLNTEDVADYLGSAQITTQTAFGMQYVENFLGFRVAMISALVPAGTIYATAAENLVIAFADMAGSDVAKTFGMYVDETGLIGVTHDVNKERLTAETITASALVLFPERLNGVIKSTITPAGV